MNENRCCVVPGGLATGGFVARGVPLATTPQPAGTDKLSVAVA